MCAGGDPNGADACPDQVLKVIIETCLLTREEKVRMW